MKLSVATQEKKLIRYSFFTYVCIWYETWWKSRKLMKVSKNSKILKNSENSEKVESRKKFKGILNQKIMAHGNNWKMVKKSLNFEIFENSKNVELWYGNSKNGEKEEKFWCKVKQSKYFKIL